MIPFVDNNKVARQKVCIYVISIQSLQLFLFSLHLHWTGAGSPYWFCCYCCSFIKKEK